MNTFLTSNDWKWRLARTIVQGVIGVAVANIDVLVGFIVLEPSIKAVVVVIHGMMAVLGLFQEALMVILMRLLRRLLRGAMVMEKSVGWL